MSKKVVHYRTDRPFSIQVGVSAFVWPVDHPDSENVSNTCEVQTSTVLRIFESGEFETRNTIYKPFKEQYHG